jgi:hypothetical protein
LTRCSFVIEGQFQEESCFEITVHRFFIDGRYGNTKERNRKSWKNWKESCSLRKALL